MENHIEIINGTTVIRLLGNALDTDCDILCHQVNLYRSMGGGIAKEIAIRYPEVKREYINFNNSKLGEVCFAKTKTYVIANCFSQDGFTTDYEALNSCLDKVVEYLNTNNLNSVAIPYHYGCGIASGDWDKVNNIFIKKLAGYTLKIYKI